MSAVFESDSFRLRVARKHPQVDNVSLTPIRVAELLEEIVYEINANPALANSKQVVSYETRLAGALVRYLRMATGGEPELANCMPFGGRPSYEVAAAFIKAAGWNTITAAAIRYRLSDSTRLD